MLQIIQNWLTEQGLHPDFAILVSKSLAFLIVLIGSLIADRIAGLDKEVFLENPIKKIIILKMRPPSEAKRIAYIPEEDAVSNEPEHYVIYDYGLKKIIEQERRKRVILLSKSGKSEDFTKMTLEEVFIGIAAHEVGPRLGRSPAAQFARITSARKEERGGRFRDLVSLARRSALSHQLPESQDGDRSSLQPPPG